MDLKQAEAFVADGQWAPLIAWLRSLTADDRGLALRWYRSSLRAKARREAQNTWSGPRRAIQVALAVGLAETPEEAAKNAYGSGTTAFSSFTGYEADVAGLLLGRGSEWAYSFATVVSNTRNSRTGGAPMEIAVLIGPTVFGTDQAGIGEGFFHGWVSLIRIAKSASQRPESKWQPPRFVTLIDGTPQVAYDRNSTLSDVLRATPDLTRMLSGALAVPDLFTEWRELSGEQWDVELAVRGLIRQGALDRDRLVESVMQALTRNDKPSAQRLMAELLLGADFGPSDVKGRIPLLTQLFSTAQGAVVAVILDALLATTPSDDVVSDIGTLVLVRKEKAQKVALMKYLASATESPARRQLLELAGSDADATLVARASAAAGGAQTAHAAPTWDVAWTLEVTGEDATPFRRWPADASGFDAAESDAQTWVRLTSEAARLDLAVRLAAKDAARLRSLVQQKSQPSAFGVAPTTAGLRRWAAAQSTAVNYQRTPTVISMGSDGDMKRQPQTVTISPPGYIVFTDHLVAETMLRLGKLPELLSTPSRSDGSLTLDDLVDRLGRARRFGVGPYDLVQALLRLEPTQPSDADRLRGLSVDIAWPVNRTLLGIRRSNRTDAIDVLRYWIQHGGLPLRRVSLQDEALAASAVELPLSPQLAQLSGLPEMCGLIETPRLRFGGWWHTAGFVGVAPYWSDAAAASLSHSRQDRRIEAADQLLALARRGRIEPDLLAEQSTALLSAGKLSLARLASAWEHLIISGSLGFIWPSIRGVLSAAADAPRKPAGLANALRVPIPFAGTLVANAANPVLPRSVLELAQSRGTSKAAVEARQLVAAVNGASR